MVKKNYYLTLGIPRTESISGIRAAFRALAKRYHPERIGASGTRFFADILQAYQVLSDPEKRCLYDQGLTHAEGGSGSETPTIIVETGEHVGSTMPVPVALLSRFAMVNPPYEQLRAQVARNFLHPSPSSAPIQSFNVQIVLSPTEALRGGIALITIPVFYPCPSCGGSGQDGFFSCSSCQSQGLMEEEESVRVRIPPGVGDYTLMETPVRGLGLHNVRLRLYVRVLA